LASSLTRAMESQNVRRLIVISAGGVADSFSRLTWPVQQLVDAGSVAVAYRDLAGMEARLAASSLDWLAVRPVTLMNGAPLGRARPVDRYALTSTIRRADLAAWMLAAALRHDSFCNTRSFRITLMHQALKALDRLCRNGASSPMSAIERRSGGGGCRYSLRAAVDFRQRPGRSPK
jgi:pimeloyl-ACP methyl ester carboxylesterase